MEQVEQLGHVGLIMACAVGGTVGILKVIKRFSPNGEFPKDPIAKKLEETEHSKNGVQS